MPLAAQAKILRFLEDQTFERVGGGESIRTRVRVLAATNQNLEQLIATGRFRSDLYYRLKEITLLVPPLRDRAEDSAELAHHFLLEFAREVGRDVFGFAPEVLEIFRYYPWPGNVRELRGAIKEAALRTTGRTIQAEFLPKRFVEVGRNANQSLSVSISDDRAKRVTTERPLERDIATRIETMLNAGEKEMYDRLVGAVERELITRVLRLTHGHLGNACERLGIDRKTLRNRLRDLHIIPDKFANDSNETALE